MPDGFLFKSVAVFGLGLLGGSLCRALRAASPPVRLSAWGRSVDRLKPALEDGIVDRVGTLEEADLRGVDLAVVATPVVSSIAIIRDILDNGALVIDVGSVKEEIVRGVIDHPRAGRFVACHPMAGSEKTGYLHGRADLYEGSAVIITPHEKNRDDVLDAVSGFWERLGARTVRTSPAEHDALVARTSHLPHMVSCVLVEQLAGALEKDAAGPAGLFIGRGFRDMTRIAAGSEEIWSEISALNAENIAGAIDDFIDRLESLKGMIRDAGEKPDALSGYLAKIRKVREDIS